MSTVSGVSSSGGVRGVVVEPGTTGRGANDLRRGPLAGWTLRRRLVVLTSLVTATEYELLRYLMRNPRRVLSKAQILDRVWSYDFGGKSSVV